MARKRKSKLRSRGRGRAKPARAQSLNRPELWGLGLVALGAFLGSILYFGWNGGYVGHALERGLDALIGGASWGLPVLLVALGGLVVARSALVDVRPFRTGLAVLVLGLLVTLGKAHGGYAGRALGGAVGLAVGVTGSTILGALLLLVGGLLLSGASLGAILRRSGHGVRRAATRARLPRSPREPWPEPAAIAAPLRTKKPVDAEQAYPDVVGDEASPLVHLGPSPLVHA
jgi:hypothetical protein